MRYLWLLCLLAFPAWAQERVVMLQNAADQEFCINAAARAEAPVTVGRCEGDAARFVLRAGQPGIQLAANRAFCLFMTVGGEPTYLTVNRCSASREFHRLVVEESRIFSDEFGPACVAALRGLAPGARLVTTDCANNARQRWAASVIAAATGPNAWGRASGWDVTVQSAGGQFRGCQAERQLPSGVDDLGKLRINLDTDLTLMMDYPYGATITQPERILVQAGRDRDRVVARPGTTDRMVFEISPPIARTLVEQNIPHLRIEISGNEPERIPTANFRAVWDMLNDCVDKRGAR
jgi:hypothetical protein